MADYSSHDFRTSAWKTHPFVLIAVKFQAFRRIVGERRYCFHTGIDPNSFGLRQNGRFLGIRNRCHRAALDVMDFLPISWLSHHCFWFVANLVALLVAGWQVLRKRSSLGLLTVIVLLLPMCYTLGVALAMAKVDYRFLLPSTLLMQVMAGGWIAALALGWQRGPVSLTTDWGGSPTGTPTRAQGNASAAPPR